MLHRERNLKSDWICMDRFGAVWMAILGISGMISFGILERIVIDIIGKLDLKSGCHEQDPRELLFFDFAKNAVYILFFAIFFTFLGICFSLLLLNI